jgi:hypothetical protein
LPDPARTKATKLVIECLFANDQGLNDWAAVLGRRQMQCVAATGGNLVAAIGRRDLDLACKLWAWGAPVPPADALWQAIVDKPCNEQAANSQWDTSLVVTKIIGCSIVETNRLLELCSKRITNDSAVVMVVAACTVLELDCSTQLVRCGAPSSAGDAVRLLHILGEAQARQVVGQLSICDTQYGQNLLKFVELLSGLDVWWRQH